MQLINDKSKRTELFTAVKECLDKHLKIKSAVLKENGWIAIPVESAAYFDEEKAEKLSTAMLDLGIKDFYAIQYEEWDIADLNMFKVLSTKEDILEFSFAASSFYYVMFPEDKSFLIICSPYDYYIVAGKKEFVLKALGKSVEEARKEFLSFANDSFWPEKDRRNFIEIYSYYLEMST